MPLLKYAEVSLGSVVDQDRGGGRPGQSSPSATSHTGFEVFYNAETHLQQLSPHLTDEFALRSLLITRQSCVMDRSVFNL